MSLLYFIVSIVLCFLLPPIGILMLLFGIIYAAFVKK